MDFPEIDLVDSEGVRSIVRRVRPLMIVNAAAYTAVDKAENETQLAMAINGVAPGILAEEAHALGSVLIHYSTDYVFDGRAGRPYLEGDSPSPLNVYGHSKLAGEQAIQQVGGSYLVFRTSWVYSLRQGGFVNKVLEWARRPNELKIVSDQVSNPTWCRMLAEVTSQVIAQGMHAGPGWFGERQGIYHLAGSGYASRLDWARAILENDPRREEQLTAHLLPAATAEFPTPAVRPLFSALNCDRFSRVFSLRLPDWEIALRLAMETEC